MQLILHLHETVLTCWPFALFRGVTKKVKSISDNIMGDKVGRIHVGRQDLNSMQVRHVKALRDSGHGKSKTKQKRTSSSDCTDEDRI